MMKWIVNITAALCLAVMAYLWLDTQRGAEQTAAAPAQVQTALHRLYDRTSYHGALMQADRPDASRWPAQVDPAWFGGRLPRNVALAETPTKADAAPRPWLDLAPPGDESLHPPDPVAVRQAQAEFWYNPNVGIFRARVPGHLSRADALTMYNQINAVELERLVSSAEPLRQPLAYQPGQAPGTLLASPPSPTNPPTQVTSLFASDIPADLNEADTPTPARPSPPAVGGGRRRGLSAADR